MYVLHIQERLLIGYGKSTTVAQSVSIPNVRDDISSIKPSLTMVSNQPSKANVAAYRLGARPQTTDENL
jgi:hypothetical protein